MERADATAAAQTPVLGPSTKIPLPAPAYAGPEDPLYRSQPEGASRKPRAWRRRACRAFTGRDRAASGEGRVATASVWLRSGLGTAGGLVEGVVAKLLTDFEDGRMTRRQLIRSLAALAAAGPTAAGARTPTPAPAAASSAPWRTVRVDHISYQVTDYRRSVEFYTSVMGWEVQS